MYDFNSSNRKGGSIEGDIDPVFKDRSKVCPIYKKPAIELLETAKQRAHNLLGCKCSVGDLLRRVKSEGIVHSEVFAGGVYGAGMFPEVNILGGI